MENNPWAGLTESRIDWERREANKLLDRVREGGLVSPRKVEWALKITGDISGWRSKQ